jgi:ribose 5-phosphate isomerase A
METVVIDRNKANAADAKKRVGIAAAAMVPDGAIIGLGTGSTTAFAIEELGRRIREEGFRCQGAPTSYQAAILARKHKIPLITLDDGPELEVAIDGADEVDPQGH